MKQFTNWRTNIVLIVIIILGAAILSRLFFLQILERKLYGAQAIGQQTAFNSVVGSRGQIFCENSQETKGMRGSGEIKSLAINRDSWSISANPKDIQDKVAFAEVLSKNINQTQDQILSEISGQDSYVTIEKDLSSDDLNKVRALNLKGLSWQKIPDRFYPQGQMASQTLGFLGGAGSGQYGIEGYYDDILQGKSGVEEEKSGLDSIFSGGDQISLDGSALIAALVYKITVSFH